MDDFDLICHVAFDQPVLTRLERANNVRKRNYFTKETLNHNWNTASIQMQCNTFE